MSEFAGKKCVVTGGLGFIGSHLVERLLELGAEVTVIDFNVKDSLEVWEAKLRDFSRLFKMYENLKPLAYADLLNTRVYAILQGSYAVFHLAAIFGGREFVDLQQADCCAGFAINHNVISQACEAGVEKVHFASSACVYPPDMQDAKSYPLEEYDVLAVDPRFIESGTGQPPEGKWWTYSDNTYGWVKLMGELELKAYHDQYGLKGSTARFLTVYGPREYDRTHAIAMLMYKAITKQDPYVVWGSGEQERGFTYVDDIVNGMLLATEKIEDATPVNLGTDKRYKIREVANKILAVADHRPKKVIFDKDKPEGPRSRALNITRAKELLGWEPKVSLDEGLHRTYAWAEEALHKRGDK